MILLALLLAATAPAHAEGPFPRKERKVYAVNEDILAVNRSASLSYLRSHLYYIEPSANTAVNTGTDYLDYEEGPLKGGKAAASWMTDGQWYLHGEWAGAEGKIDYTGFLVPAAPAPFIPITIKSRATTQDYLVRAGKGFNTGERSMLTPHFSLGGRHWTRVVGVGTPYSATESYHHYFFAVGSLLQFAPWKRLVGTLDASVGGIFRPRFQEPIHGFNDAPLGASAIIKIGGEIDGRVTSSLHLFSGLDYMTFEYGRSAVSSFGFLEPDSRTQALNFNFGLRYSFNALASS